MCWEETYYEGCHHKQLKTLIQHVSVGCSTVKIRGAGLCGNCRVGDVQQSPTAADQDRVQPRHLVRPSGGSARPHLNTPDPTAPRGGMTYVASSTSSSGPAQHASSRRRLDYAGSSHQSSSQRRPGPSARPHHASSSLGLIPGNERRQFEPPLSYMNRALTAHNATTGESPSSGGSSSVGSSLARVQRAGGRRPRRRRSGEHESRPSDADDEMEEEDD